jgi:acetyl esterase
MALDEATTSFLAQMAASGAKPLHEMTPEEARAMGVELCALFGPAPEMLRVEESSIATDDGGALAVRLLVPSERPQGLVVYFHGGGWVVGALDEWDTLARRLAERTDCAVVLVDYRLAPEHRHPAAAEDAWTALRWAAAHSREITGAEVPLIVAGDSAGGNLAAVVSRRARDEAGPEIALQVLVYPVTDCDLETASYTDPENQLMVSRDAMVWFWDHYVADPQARLRPDASPLRAEDLSGLPAAVVLTAEHDVLRDEGEAYAERLRQAGVAVRHQRFAGQMHGFFSMVDLLPGSAAGMDYVVEAIQRELAAAATP